MVQHVMDRTMKIQFSWATFSTFSLDSTRMKKKTFPFISFSQRLSNPFIILARIKFITFLGLDLSSKRGLCKIPNKNCTYFYYNATVCKIYSSPMEEFRSGINYYRNNNSSDLQPSPWPKAWQFCWFCEGRYKRTAQGYSTQQISLNETHFHWGP